jgi:hypothetical protein
MIERVRSFFACHARFIARAALAFAIVAPIQLWRDAS